MSTSPTLLDALALQRLMPPPSAPLSMGAGNPLLTMPPPPMPNVVSDPNQSGAPARVPVVVPSEMAVSNPATPLGPTPTGAQPTPSFLAPRGTIQGDTSELARLTNSGSGIQQMLHPLDANGNPSNQPVGFWQKLGGIGAAIGDTALRLAAPKLEQMIPGTEGHHQLLLAQDNANVGHDLDYAQMQAMTSQEQSKALQEQAKAYQLVHPKLTTGQLLYDKSGSPIGFQGSDGSYMGPNDPNLPGGVGDILSAAQRKQPTSAFELWQSQNPKGSAEDYLKLTAEGKVKALPEQYNDALAAGDETTAQRILNMMRNTAAQSTTLAQPQNPQNPQNPRHLRYGIPSGAGGVMMRPPVGMVRVQIPGEQPGFIPFASLVPFKRDHPRAQVVQ